MAHASAPRSERGPTGITASAGTIAAAVAIATALADDAAPTGHHGADAIWRVVGAVVIVVASMAAPPAAWLTSGVATAVVARDPIALAAAVVMVVIGAGALVRATARTPPWGAIVGTACTAAAFRLPTWQPVGTTTIVAVGCSAPIAIAAFARAHPDLRRGIGVVVAVATALSSAAALSLGWRALSVRADLERAGDLLGEAELRFRQGDTDAARAGFADAVDVFSVARGRTTSIDMRLMRYVPIIGQHASLLRTVAEDGEAVADSASAVLEALDRDALTIAAGRVPIGEAIALREPVRALARRLDLTTDRLRSARSPWLLPPAAEALDTALEDLEPVRGSAQRAVDVLDVAPSLLGADGPRTHLVLFSTPAESRGAGGLLGNWALLRTDDGVIGLVDRGRVESLVRRLDGAAPLTAPSRYVEHYGGYGIDRLFADLTVSPDASDVAVAAADRFAAATGTNVDTVVVVDPSAVQALVDITGPVTVAGVELSGSDVLRFLLVDQYVRFADSERARVRALDQLVTATVGGLLAVDQPDPWDLDEILGPVVDAKRLTVNSLDPDEQATLGRLGITGAFPTGGPERGDLIGFVTQNGGRNKMDAFVQRSLDYRATVDSDEASVHATATVVLRNTVEVDGLPDAIVGSNDQGLPAGTARQLVSIYSPLVLDTISVDGHTADVESVEEFGVRRYSVLVDIAPGSEVVVAAVLDGAVAGPIEPYAVTIPVQPAAVPTHVGVEVIATSGTGTERRLVSYDGDASGDLRLLASTAD